MKTVKIKFENVGRSKLAWDADISVGPRGEFNASDILSSIKKKRALASNGVDIEYDGEKNEGIIYAGFRPVGSFSAELPKA